MQQLRKMWFNINGADRMVVCDPEKDSLSDVLRRIGLTGTKVSCRKNVCGACSVIVDGKLVKSCSRKMGKMDEFSKIITIEGIGTPMRPHPLQEAFVNCGAVQCGFCTPGFIVAAYALLLDNPSPTREEVRAWFQKNRNACRCTGYKQIVDAVMIAASVMRGEAKTEDFAYKYEGKYYNTRVPRPSALAKACGVLDYGEDVSLKMPEETLHLAIVQPRVAHHAKILNIDVSEAEKMPGVVKVLTAKDLQGNNRVNAFAMHKRAKISGPTRPIISDEIIYRYGDVIGCVIADTREHAREAAKFVKLDYEKLPEYTSYLDAVMPDARQIHPEAPNIYAMQPVIKGEEADEIIENSPYSVEGSFRTPREPHLSVEGDIVQAYWDEDGMMTIHCKSQSIFSNLNTMAKGIGIDKEKLRIVHNAVGGSFGWATEPTSFAITAACCMATGKPVSLAMSYEEFMHFSGKRTSSHINGRLACDENGIITALEYDMGVDHGAYLEGEAIMGKISCFGNPYKIPNLRGLIRMGATNHNFGTAYRGYGFPQVTTAMESLMDMLAEKAGIDPFEFRFKNLLREGDLTVSLRPLDHYSYEDMYNAARPYYLECKERAAKESTPELKRGVGLATMYFNPLAGPFDKAEVALELMSDNRIRLNDTWQDVGQGGDVGSLTVALEALKPMNVTPDRIQLDLNDSKYCPDTGISASSRSNYMGGNAIIDASKKLMDAMRKSDGSYRTYDEMMAENIPVRYIGHYDIAGLNMGGKNPDTGEGESSPTGMYGFCIAEVAVDTNTGKAQTLSIKMWADAGVIGNYDSAEGQAYGGLSHDIGYALSEDYDDVMKHDNIMRAGIPYIEDVPDNMEIVWIESNPRVGGPYGSSGLSELFQSGEHMAILNGVYSACGVRIFELPAYPEKIKAGLEKIARGEKTESPARYFLGSNLYDELEEIKANPVNDLKVEQRGAALHP